MQAVEHCSVWDLGEKQQYQKEQIHATTHNTVRTT